MLKSDAASQQAALQLFRPSCREGEGTAQHWRYARALVQGVASRCFEGWTAIESAKEILKHGGFGSFCREVMKTDVRMCEYYINIADLADEIGSEFVERMPASSAAVLSSAPPDILSQVVDEMKDGGKCPSVRKIRERIRDTRSNGESVATVEQDDERVAGVASILIKKLEKQELADPVDLAALGHEKNLQPPPGNRAEPGGG
jgi:hypothetical protein